jgi:Tol biopolymer transport system component
LPSGRRIAYTPIEGADGIYTIKVGGGGNFNLTKSPKNASLWNSWPSYSPDGEIYTMGASEAGGGKSRVTTGDAYPYGLSWGPWPLQ